MKNERETTLKALYPIAVVVLIALLAFGIRMWKLDTAPKGALIDELHFGYLAQSLLLTGADEHGQQWPLVFKGFGDQKLPAMAYLDILPVALWGLSLVAIRIPSVIAGTLAVFVIYWLLRELSFSKEISMLGALITAFSPWTFFLSRFGFESNIALLFLLVGLACVFRALKEPKVSWLVASSVFLALTWYAYIAYRPISSFIWVCVTGIFLCNKKIQKSALFFIIPFLLVVAPLFAPNVVGVNSTRLNQVGIFTDGGLALRIDENRTFCAMEYPRILCDVVWNKPVLIARLLTQRYLSTFSPNFLVSVGELDLHFLTVEGFGQFYPVLYPFFVIGIVGLFLPSKLLGKKQRLILLVGLLLSPLPTVLAGDPQKVRLSMWFPFVLIAMLLGLQLVLHHLNTRFQVALMVLVLLGNAAFGFLYLTEYFSVHTTKYEYYYQSYLPSLYDFLETLPQSTQLYFKPFYSDPLMFYAFYTNMSPKEYQQQAKLGELEASGFQHTVEISRAFVTSNSLETIGCAAKLEGVAAVYVTDQKIENAKMIYEGKATNGVHTYVYVYDALSVVPDEGCRVANE